ADQHNLAPTCSTIAQLAIGDALAMCLASMNDFQEKDFARNHPGGMLGKALNLEVSHLLHLHEKPVVYPDQAIDQVIIEMTATRLGATAGLEDDDHTTDGIITDRDLRRMLMTQSFSQDIKARDIMTPDPICIPAHTKATAAIDTMRRHSITQLIVTRDHRYSGMIHLHDLLNQGFENK